MARLGLFTKTTPPQLRSATEPSWFCRSVTALLNVRFALWWLNTAVLVAIPGKVADIVEGKLRCRLREIAAEHTRWGRRVGYVLLRRDGWTVKHKREQWLWRSAPPAAALSQKAKALTARRRLNAASLG